MKKIIIILLIFIPVIVFSQNVGIGNPIPNEKLDVTGNINVTGTIKANGVDGTSGQVLMKNASGNLVWGDLCEYKNFQTFKFSGNFIVPTGVTKIFVEIWGSGGGGNNYGGGGGGGYACGIFNVTTGNTHPAVIGLPGTGSTTGAAGIGGDCTFTVGAFTLLGIGGDGAGLLAFEPGSGGIFSGTGGFSYTGRDGSPGSSTVESFVESAAGTFLRTFKYGNGGNAGNAPGTGGNGGNRAINSVTLAQIYSYPGNSITSVPGGGGAAGLAGKSGARGLVIVHY